MDFKKTLSKMLGNIETAEDAKKYYEKKNKVPKGWLRNIYGEFSKREDY